MGGMTRLLLLLWAGVTVGSVVDLQKRIIGGHDCADDDKRGYHVFLIFNDGNGDFLCCGSLIDKEWILTASHCWKPGWTVTAVFGRDANSGNKVTINDKPEIFEDKDDKGNPRIHDIMLLRLPKPTKIPPVPLPLLPVDCTKKPKIGETVQIAGFYTSTLPGQKKEPQHLDESKPLQCANTKVVNCAEFKNCLQKSHPKMYQDLLCYDDKIVDASGGDSGGGVVFNDMIYGVHVSSDAIACGGAAASMDVCSYLVWIQQIMSTPRPKKCVGSKCGIM